MPDVSVNSAQTNLPQLIDEVAQSHKPILTIGARVNAVLLSEEDWASIQETLYLLSVSNLRESIKAGLATPIKGCDGDLDWRVGNWSKNSHILRLAATRPHPLKKR